MLFSQALVKFNTPAEATSALRAAVVTPNGVQLQLNPYRCSGGGWGVAEFAATAAAS